MGIDILFLLKLDPVILEKEEYKHITANKPPAAEISFVDKIFKASRMEFFYGYAVRGGVGELMVSIILIF